MFCGIWNKLYRWLQYHPCNYLVVCHTADLVHKYNSIGIYYIHNFVEYDYFRTGKHISIWPKRRKEKIKNLFKIGHILTIFFKYTFYFRIAPFPLQNKVIYFVLFNHANKCAIIKAMLHMSKKFFFFILV